MAGVRRKLGGLVADGAIAAIIRSRRAPKPEPAPVLPRAWVEAVLADLVAVDVERWRRFGGAISRTDRDGDAHWRLELSKDAAEQHTLPVLTGELILTHDGTSDVVPQAYAARVTLLRTRAGVIDASIQVDGIGRGSAGQRGTLRRAAPPREGVAGSGPPADETQPRRWKGFPGPVTEIRPQLPLEAAVGAEIDLAGLGAVSANPDELLLAVRRPGAAGPDLLLRVEAQEPFEDDAPDYLEGAGQRVWNESAELDREHRIDHGQVTDDRLTVGGERWLVVLRARGLSARVERLA